MSITGNPAKKNLGNGGWELTSNPSDLSDPTYYAVRDGVLFSQNKTGVFRFQLQPGERLRVEIVDDLLDISEDAYPGRGWLQWDTAPTATSYRIDQWVASAWTQVSQLQASTLSVYDYITDFLDNLTQYKFRVVPIIAANDGYAREYDFYMHRRPNEPTVNSFAYDSGTNTITADVS
jgi:hypothetical protein